MLACTVIVVSQIQHNELCIDHVKKDPIIIHVTYTSLGVFKKRLERAVVKLQIII